MMTKQKCYSPFCNMPSFPAFVYHDCTKTWVRRKPRLDLGTQGLPKELLCVEREWESGNVGCLSNTCKKSSPFSSVSVIQPHRQQHFRLPCPSPTPRHAQTHVHRVDDAIQPSHPRSTPSPPAPNPSQHQSLFQCINSSHEVAKYWNFSFSIIPSKEIPGLISFRMDWLDLLAIQGTLKSLLQHHSSKASILQRSAFFTV